MCIRDRVPGAHGVTYDPGVITETTYFVRCARRVGCNIWVESNCMVKEVYCSEDNTQEGENGATPAREAIACEDVQITYGNGQIEMAGIAGENYYFKVNAIDQGWAVVHGCSSNCGSTQTATDLAPGRYIVTIFNVNWTQHCQTEVVLKSTLREGAVTRNRAAVGEVTTKAPATMQSEVPVNRNVNLSDFQVGTVTFDVLSNPAGGQLSVNLSSLAGQQGQLYFSNQMGQVLKTLSIDTIDAKPVQLDLGPLTSGTYHFIVEVNRRLIMTEKVIIQHQNTGK